MTVDTEGRIYMATTLGIQVFDQLGKCHGILRMPGEPAVPYGPESTSSAAPRRCSAIVVR